ncbi:Fur family transcriptional regulator [Streptacidiphilus sp. MAP5-3]|uniref:Fur family transcriptional regulator n=1 Tax=unclassified Streptacidiphilus TaxID=2643834 RepID=UPI003517AFB5
MTNGAAERGTARGAGRRGQDRLPQPEAVALLGRPTQQRVQVLRALMACTDFVSAQDLHAALHASGSTVGLSTIYRTLTALVGTGRADLVRDTNGERLFRYRPDAEHRHYLICRECGLSLPLDSRPVETWASEVAEQSGFVGVDHTVELSGTCASCASR